MREPIHQRIELPASPARVWKAVTDHREFGEWFKVRLSAPFVAGQPASGQITYPGYEHVTWRVNVLDIQPERLFSFTWHPYAVDSSINYEDEEPTLVEFYVEPFEDGTLLTITESGFEHVPAHRRLEAYRMNERGWSEQAKNIREYLATRD